MTAQAGCRAKAAPSMCREADASHPVLRVVRRDADRLLVLAAGAFMVVTVWDVSAPRIIWQLALAASGIAIAGSLPNVRGSTVGFAILWAALGTAMGLTAAGLLGVSPWLPIAPALLAGAIATAPNLPGQPSRWQPVYSVAYCAAPIAVLSLPFLPFV